MVTQQRNARVVSARSQLSNATFFRSYNKWSVLTVWASVPPLAKSLRKSLTPNRKCFNCVGLDLQVRGRGFEGAGQFNSTGFQILAF